MPNGFFRSLSVMTTCCLVVAGCGSKATEGVQPQNSSTLSAKKAADSSGDDSVASSGGAWGCSNYGAGGVDYQSQSAAYLFIGEHPMCTDKDKVEDFCASLSKRDGFQRAESDNAAAEALREVAKGLPEESREGYLQQHPLHGFEQAMAKCGLKPDQVRSQLVAEAEASITTGGADQNDSIAFLVAQAPATAGAIWTRECAGRMDQKTVGEGFDWEFKGNPVYKNFCTSTSDSSVKPAKFKGSATH